MGVECIECDRKKTSYTTTQIIIEICLGVQHFNWSVSMHVHTCKLNIAPLFCILYKCFAVLLQHSLFYSLFSLVFPYAFRFIHTSACKLGLNLPVNFFNKYEIAVLMCMDNLASVMSSFKDSLSPKL